ncbi:hypothetical protein ERX46_13915 [Brumimicrobium glaciale]|uniref:T9SS type B sorting domain-containing protein n=1 Tax=Brumimicrobium glaciale TaxID=200475 RepID=A0A4Q4KJD0_9FLAO|nr:PKD domain-containing protein [Brumimicrobium glaciale]RYM32374.1 hypothetical protein ERX46_13915 [Brumimicrobium glaciale]
MKTFFSILLFVIIFGINRSHSQNFIMTNGATVTTCTGTFYDSGGPTGDYSNNENITFTICPGNGSSATVDFTFFDIDFIIWDNLTIYDGNSTSAPVIGIYGGATAPNFIVASSTNISGCLTFVFISNPIAPQQGWAATIGCVNSCQQIIANATFSPSPDPDGIIRICQGNTVNFNGSGTYPQNNNSYAQSDATSIFTWNTQDGSNPVGKIASHTFSNEGVFFVDLEIEDLTGCANDAPFTQEIHVSTTPDFSGTVGTPNSICLGDQATLNGVVSPVTFDKSCVQPNFSPIFINGGNGQSIVNSVNLECFITGQTFTNISELGSICVNMNHSTIGDLEIGIECPSGQSVILKEFLGGSTSNLGVTYAPGYPQGIGFNYCWTPNATGGTWASNTNGTSILPSGVYESDNPMSALVGCDLNGLWTFTITDNTTIDNGHFFDWSIDFDPSIIPPSTTFTPTIISESWQPDPTIISGTNPITVVPATSGNACYTYEATDNFGCVYDTTYCINVQSLSIDALPDITQCVPYILPVITGSSLSGNQAYYTGINGTGTQFNAGDAITASTLMYIYDSFSTGLSCEVQNSFNITIGVSSTVLNCPPATSLSGSSLLPPPFANFNAFISGGGTISFGFGTAAVINSFTFLSDVTTVNGCQETITRTYQVTDGCGVNETCSQIFNIADNIDPTGSAPTNITIQCIGNLPPANIALITDEADNNTVNPIVSFVSDVSDGNTCPEIITRTYNIADDCGNNIDVTQTITINDNIPPTGTAPADATIQCIGDFPAADITSITNAADNCTVNPVVSFVGDVSDGNTCPEIITRTYNIADDCGNNIDVTQTITINDDINPTGTAPADLTIQCIGDLPPANINLITDEADNCTAIPAVTFVGEVSDGNTCPEIITRTYNIADDCGNNINLIQTITINDDINPTASNPVTTTVQCLTDVPAVDISVVSDEADNCTAIPIVAFVSESTDGNSCNGEIITRIYSVTDDCGNSINVNHTILVDSYTPNFTVSGQGTNSCNGTDGEITLSGLSPNTNYEMSYDFGVTNAITTNAAGNYVITGLPAGSYTNYTVSDADCSACTTTENVSININDPTAAIINAGPDEQYCEGETIILNAINPENANITWNNGITDGVGFIQPVGTTFYTITAERVNCFSSDQMSITVSPAITGITCPGDLTALCEISEQAPYADFNAFISAGGSATIPVGGVIDSASFTLLSEVSDGIICPETITRTYQIADTCGVSLSCTQQIVISEIILPTATPPNDTTVQCIGDVPIVDVLSITDEADNCSAIPIVTHVSDVSDGNTCPESITRTYNIEDKCGNNIDVIQTITINDDILPTASNPDTIFVACLADVPLPDIAVVTNEADNCTANPTVAFVSDNSDGNTCNGEEITRIYSIADDCGNTINVSQIIKIELFNPVFTVSSTNPTTCDGNEGTITISGLAPNFNYELTYDSGTPFSITTDAVGEFTITGLVQGNYTDFTIIEGTCLTCSTNENITITLTDPIPPIVNAGIDIAACENDLITLTAFNPENANISWNNGVIDGFIFSPPVGISTYTVTAERVNCFTTDQVQVTINPLPNVDAGPDYTVCDGDETTLSGSGADTYLWDNGVIDNVPFTPSLGLTTYIVVGTSVFGCVNTDQVDVEVIISPDISFTANQTVGCSPQEINLISTSSGIGNQCLYTINGVDQVSGCNVNYIFKDAGCFDVTLQVELTNGCIDDFTVSDYICIDDYPIADFKVNPEEITNIYNKVDFINESTGATNYEWDFGDESFSNEINPTHEYSVNSIKEKAIFDLELIATSNLGCKDTFNLDLPFFEELVYFIPNTFTPDGNKFNETFRPIFTTGFDPLDYKLEIFNRWGEMIFESNDAYYGWDGSYGSSNVIFAPEGVYVWKISYKILRDDENAEIVGSVNLIR